MIGHVITRKLYKRRSYRNYSQYFGRHWRRVRKHHASCFMAPCTFIKGGKRQLWVRPFEWLKLNFACKLLILNRTRTYRNRSQQKKIDDRALRIFAVPCLDAGPKRMHHTIVPPYPVPLKVLCVLTSPHRYDLVHRRPDALDSEQALGVSEPYGEEQEDFHHEVNPPPPLVLWRNVRRACEAPHNICKHHHDQHNQARGWERRWQANIEMQV